jgi:alpha-tubulin suppressor-like RCC1 family protein
MLRTFLIAFIMIVHHNKILSQCWKDIYCGEDFTLAISDDNKCWAWGDNYINQFSNGDFFKSFNPEMIGEFVGWVKDSQDKIAIVKNENGEFFIYNKAFFLGDHDVESKEWKYISRKGDFTIGIKKDGTLWSWGDNAFGSLGDGTKVNSQVPKRIGKPVVRLKQSIFYLI